MKCVQCKVLLLRSRNRFLKRIYLIRNNPRKSILDNIMNILGISQCFSSMKDVRKEASGALTNIKSSISSNCLSKINVTNTRATQCLEV